MIDFDRLLSVAENHKNCDTQTSDRERRGLRPTDDSECGEANGIQDGNCRISLASRGDGVQQGHTPVETENQGLLKGGVVIRVIPRSYLDGISTYRETSVDHGTLE